MATDDYIKRSNHSSRRYSSVPLIVSMVDTNGKLVALPYPSQIDTEKEIGGDGGIKIDWSLHPEKILGVEFPVSPASVSSNLSKIVNRTPTMTAWVEEHWGEELDTLTFQGQTAAFVTNISGSDDVYKSRLTNDSNTQKLLQGADTLGQLDEAMRSQSSAAGTGVRDDEIGLTTSRRRNSLSYRQLLRLLDVFRANGCIFDQDGFVAKRYYIQVTYGNSAYWGFFESMDVTENAVTPFRFDYVITFKAEKTLYSYVNQGSTLLTNPWLGTSEVG